MFLYTSCEISNTTLGCHQTPIVVRDYKPEHAVGAVMASNKVFSPWKVLLVSSSRHPDQWIVPGGGMEPEEEPYGAAMREVYEEVRTHTQLYIGDFACT